MQPSALVAAQGAPTNYMEAPQPAHVVCPGVWLLQSSFKFYGLFQTGLNGLVLRVAPNGHPKLVLINPPQLTPLVKAQLQRIEAETQAKVEVILQPGDWHHFQLPAAQALFPEAVMYVASGRNLRKQPKIHATVLDRLAPSVPELGDEVALLPWLGFTQDGIPRALSGEKRGAHRVEAIVHHRPSGTLFFTDHFFNLSTDKPLKPNTSGFRLVDGAAARASARRVLDAKAQRVVFSHGPLPSCVLPPEALATGALDEAYERLLHAHGATEEHACKEVGT